MLVFRDTLNCCPGSPAWTFPAGMCWDVLVCAGDICSRGREDEIRIFDRFLEALPHRHKLVVAGNPDRCLERLGKEHGQALFNNANYLQDSAIVIDGIRFYGSPWQPEFFQWAFNLPRGKALAEKWALIPGDTDVLITHGPPFGILDLTPEAENVGCHDLSHALKRVRPQLHVFGHIHHSHGIAVQDGTTFINACICNESYKPNHIVLYYDLALLDDAARDKNSEDKGHS
jgi:metallophosphoesterase superfamily enzyme